METIPWCGFSWDNEYTAEPDGGPKFRSEVAIIMMWLLLRFTR